MPKLTEIKTLEDFQDFILYGDLHKTPLSILKDNNLCNVSRDAVATYDTEQLFRMQVVAAIEYLKNKGVL